MEIQKCDAGKMHDSVNRPVGPNDSHTGKQLLVLLFVPHCGSVERIVEKSEVSDSKEIAQHCSVMGKQGAEAKAS